ncbi:CotS family spore coat protein [Haloimpatiens lingqiaonensis]|uniref:CotS family spore coat protein n=1 Tax=Haloimpatiens lingqiaonensis TaxID=1380675 RepID=UPI0010FEBE47|nr:CotS family spore coat protein [Haloimpatiens lingqiaonensis]
MPSMANLYSNIKLLSEDNLKKYVLVHYNLQNSSIEQIKIKNTEKQRAVYKITYKDESYCLKKVYFGMQELLFVYSAVEWLYRCGLKTPRFISTNSGSRFVQYENMLFILTPWIDGVKCDYDNEEHMIKTIRNLSKMHYVTKKFHPIPGSDLRENYSNIYSSANKRYGRLLENSNLAFQYNDKFSNIYNEHFQVNETLGKISLQSSYLINLNDLSRSLCHLDYVNKNLLFDNGGNIWVIDFDKCQMDYCVHDISYFFRRLLRRDNTKWNLDITLRYLKEYEKICTLNSHEYLYLLCYLAFPQKYWRISRDYFNNINKCNKNSFVKILLKSVKTEQEQLKFAHDFIDYIEGRFKINI